MWSWLIAHVDEPFSRVVDVPSKHTVLKPPGVSPLGGFLFLGIVEIADCIRRLPALTACAHRATAELHASSTQFGFQTT